MQRPFYLMAKPSSSLCNINCNYCFYVNKELSHKKAMDDDILENYIKKYIQSCPLNQVEFIFQGGEPTVCSLDFYKKVVDLQEKYRGNKRVHNSLQTNGILVDKEYAKFFHDHNFLIGISIDGPKAIHDTVRLSKSGQGTYDKVVHAIKLLKEYEVNFNTLTVISKANVNYAKVVYTHLKELGSTYMQFIPLTGVDMTISGYEYGKFLTELFDAWSEHDIGHIHIQHIDEYIKILSGHRGSLCVFSPQCGDQLVIEQNGDIYSCDHFVFDKYKLGNIMQGNLLDIINNKEQVQFSLEKSKFDKECLECPYLSCCYGGCPAHRVNNKNTLCEGYKMAIAQIIKFFS